MADIRASERNSAFVRLDFLDSLRCFAALYVMIYHMALIPDPHLHVPEWIAMYTGNGGTGVTLFFVLSAFALSYSMDVRSGEPAPQRRFYVRRLFRIGPLFYLMLALYWVRDAVVFDVRHPWPVVLLNASFLFNLFPEHREGYVWASWTIGAEMLFYAVFPLIHSRVRTLSSALALLLISLAISHAWHWLIVHVGVPIGYLTADQVPAVQHCGILNLLHVFVLGIVAYRLFFDYLVRFSCRWRQIFGLILIALFGVLFHALLSGRLTNALWGDLTWQGICFAILTMGLGLYPFRALVNPTTLTLGKASYSLYLAHPSLIFALTPVYTWLYGHLPSATAAYVASFALTLVLLTAVSLALYRFVEKPGIALGEFLVKRWGRSARNSVKSYSEQRAESY